VLHGRRFDVVIIDEAAKADTTLAIVGDFQQSVPIAEVHDARNDDERGLVRWQTSDIFALAGITDRASAERHPSRVAISRQYWCPSVIADVVNDFRYDGLLGGSLRRISTGPSASSPPRRRSAWS
jgi:hypothetical protein